MNHYENKIDSIGESFEKDPIETTPLDKLHEDITNKNTYIACIKVEINNLDQLIKGYQTFSDNVYMIDNLKNLSQRMKNDLNSLEIACDGMVEDTEHCELDYNQRESVKKAKLAIEKALK